MGLLGKCSVLFFKNLKKFLISNKKIGFLVYIFFCEKICSVRQMYITTGSRTDKKEKERKNYNGPRL